MPTFHETGLAGVTISDPVRSSGRAPFESVMSARGVQESRRARPDYDRRFLEAFKFYQGVITGKIPTYKLEEAMTVSDFPILFGDILQRQLLGGYASLPVSWPAYVRKGTLPDATRTARRLAYDGLDGHMTVANRAPDATNGPEDHMAETGYLIGPLDVYERIVSINWKTILADDLGAFKDIPGKLALAARRTEEWLVAQMLAESTGPHSTFFTDAQGNTVVAANGATSAQPALGVQGLVDGRNVWGRMTNPVTGERIAANGSTLVIPPELEVLANFLFETKTIETNRYGGEVTGLANTSGIETRIMMNNWLISGMKYVVNQYLSTVNTTNGTTAWYLVANPTTNRPAFEIDFLQGEEAPILLRLKPDAERVGGGAADAFGSFEGGEIRFKVMHLISTARLSPLSAIASQGDGA